MSRSIYAGDFTLVSHLAPSRRQKSVRRRWMVAGIIGASLGLAVTVSGLSHRQGGSDAPGLALMTQAVR